MTPFMKYIMHGLASGQVPPSPQVMKTLKKLQREISSSKSESVPAPAKSRLREETSSDADQRVRTP